MAIYESAGGFLSNRMIAFGINTLLYTETGRAEKAL
jgi:hypothetical protein